MVATLGFLVVTLLVGPAVYRALAGFRFNLIRRGNDVAFQLVFMLLLTVGAALLGVTPMFGAFMAGIIVGTAAGETGREERASINAFSFAFFIPIYFAMVGLKLDLVHAFSPVFFLIFLAIACAAKFGAVWIGARVAGESTRPRRTSASRSTRAAGRGSCWPPPRSRRASWTRASTPCS